MCTCTYCTFISNYNVKLSGRNNWLLAKYFKLKFDIYIRYWYTFDKNLHQCCSTYLLIVHTYIIIYTWLIGLPWFIYSTVCKVFQDTTGINRQLFYLNHWTIWLLLALCTNILFQIWQNSLFWYSSLA